MKCVFLNCVVLFALISALSWDSVSGKRKSSKKKEHLVDEERTTEAPTNSDDPQNDCTGVKCHNPPGSDQHCESHLLTPTSCCPFWTCTMPDNSKVQVMGEYRAAPEPQTPFQPPNMMMGPGMGQIGPMGAMGAMGPGMPGPGNFGRPQPQPSNPLVGHPGNPGGYNFSESYSKNFAYSFNS